MKEVMSKPTLKRQVGVSRMEDADREEPVWMPRCESPQRSIRGCPRQTEEPRRPLLGVVFLREPWNCQSGLMGCGTLRFVFEKDQSEYKMKNGLGADSVKHVETRLA